MKLHNFLFLSGKVMNYLRNWLFCGGEPAPLLVLPVFNCFSNVYVRWQSISRKTNPKHFITDFVPITIFTINNLLIFFICVTIYPSLLLIS